jgi:PII-like signaling protein
VIPFQARLLRIYINASDRWRGQPVYRAVIETARAMRLAGASAFPVELSHGAQGRLRDARSDYAFMDVPVIVEIVEAPEQIEALLDRLRPMVADGFATVEPARVLRYTHHDERSASRATSRLIEDEPDAG